MDQFARRGRNHKEREPVTVGAAFETLDQGRNVRSQAHELARLDQMLAPHPTELGIVADQIRQLAALLDQVAAGEAVNLVLEIRYAQELAQNQP